MSIGRRESLLNVVVYVRVGVPMVLAVTFYVLPLDGNCSFCSQLPQML